MILHASSLNYSPPEYNVIKDIHSPIPIVLVTRTSDFRFNEELFGLDKYILVDMIEYGWSHKFENTHLFGFNQYSPFSTKQFSQFDNNRKEWMKFDEFVFYKQPLLYFKREILQKDVDETYQPIDYPFYGEILPIQSFDEYIARPLNVLHYWGRSHEDRVSTHASFWMRSRHNGATVCDNYFSLNEFLNNENNPNKWATFHIPHYMRMDISALLMINGLSKLGLSMSGAGKKCFRHAEVPTNSLMIMEENDLAWQFPWIDQENCLKYKDGDFDNHPIDKRNNPVDVIERWINTHPKVIYELYCACVENAHNYQIRNYTKHLESLIQKVL